MESKKFNYKAWIVCAGAYSAYTIGAGFSSGNEVMQFYGSWGVPYAFFAMLLGCIINAYFCASAYNVGKTVHFEKTRDIYAYWCGPRIAWVFDIFVFVFVLGIFATMFTGAGTMINQQLGLPQVVGAVIVGILAIATVLGGWKVIVNLLGICGNIIVIYIVIIGVVSLVGYGDADISQSSTVVQFVEEGKIWQAGFFGISNWWFDAFMYAGVCFIVAVPFVVNLGKSANNSMDAVFSGVFSSVFFYIATFLVVFILLSHFGAVVNPETDEMYPIPNLAVINHMFPAFGWTFAVVLIIEVYNTIVGYLWLLTDRIFGEKPKNKLYSNLFTVLACLVGITLGAVLPFSQVVNILWPVSGFVGCALMVFMVVKDVRTKLSKNTKEMPAA